MILTTFNITKVGKIWDGNLDIIKKPISNSVERTAQEVKSAAIAYYKTRRKKTSMPSMIIDSFSYQGPEVRGLTFNAVVFCGGPRAPHAIYVDQPHRNVGGKSSFEGYKFMAYGTKEGGLKVKDILEDEFSKVGIQLSLHGLVAIE